MRSRYFGDSVGSGTQRANSIRLRPGRLFLFRFVIIICLQWSRISFRICDNTRFAYSRTYALCTTRMFSVCHALFILTNVTRTFIVIFVVHISKTELSRTRNSQRTGRFWTRSQPRRTKTIFNRYRLMITTSKLFYSARLLRCLELSVLDGGHV